MPELMNRQIVLRRRPVGLVEPSDTELVEPPASEPADGEALLRTTFVGIDAAIRTWLNDQRGYLPPVQLGEVVRAAGIGEVVRSRCDAFAVGDVVTTVTGFQEYAIIRDDVQHADRGAGEGGPARGPQKCRAVVEDFGFDACIDYRSADLAAALKEHCPKGADVYFDNVGGAILDAVLGRLAQNARVVLCGVISSYLTGAHPGPANYVNLLSRTALMQGFNALDQWGRFEEAFAALRKWDEQGLLVHREHVFEAIGACVDALNGLFAGANIGKMLVKIGEPTVETA